MCIDNIIIVHMVIEVADMRKASKLTPAGNLIRCKIGLGKKFSNFAKFGTEAENGSRILNMCLFSLSEKGCGQLHPFYVLRKLTNEFLL